MGKNKKQIMALILSGVVAFTGSVSVSASELLDAKGQEAAALDDAETNEVHYSLTDWDFSKLVKWGTELVTNEDGSVTVQFGGQYSQVFFPIPDGIDPARIEKVIVYADNNEYLSLKLCDINHLDGGDAAAVVYGNNEIGRANLAAGYSMRKNVNSVGIMNLNAVEDEVYEKTFTGMTFVLGDAEAEDAQSGADTQVTELNYQLGDLESTTIFGDVSFATNEDGSTLVTFPGQYNQVSYAMPKEVDLERLESITVNTTDMSSLSVKFQADLEIQNEIAVTYGNNTLHVADLKNGATAKDIKAFVIMSLSDEFVTTVNSITFKMNDQAINNQGPINTEVQEDIPDLKDAVAAQTYEDFGMGVSICNNELSDAKLMGLVTKHFNVLTIGNELKPDATFGYASKAPGVHTEEFNGEELLVPTLDFSRGEQVLNYLLDWNAANPENQIKVRGHVLVWHSQTPEWFFREDYDANKPYVTAQEMTKRQEWYIKNVLQHYVGADSQYKDLFYGWDVVNEAVSDGRGTYRNENENSSWWAVYHSNEFIINAFRFANKYAPANIELYYNDYNEWVSSKVAGIEQLLTDVKNAEGTRIDGMGMQGHYSTVGSPTVNEFKEAARRYAAIVGQVQLTELDMKASSAYDGTKKTEAAEFTKEAYRYKEIFDAVKDLRAEGVNFTKITVWGVIDKNSWLQTSNSVGGAANGRQRQCPLLFDDYYQAKPAYWAFVDETMLEPEIKTIDIIGIAGSETLGALKDTPDAVISGADITADVYTSWNKDGIKAEFDVKDAVIDDNDAVYMYINVNGVTQVGVCERKVGKETTDGYIASTFLKASCFDLDQFGAGTEIKIDFVVVNGTKKAAFNDRTLSQENGTDYYAKATLKPFMTVTEGSAVIDGEMDEIWNSVSETPLTINLGSNVSADARLMWDEKNLYVYVDVADPVLNAESGNAHEKDSVEIFIDENNHKTDAYEDDDKQYRINYLNEQSYNGTKCNGENIQSAVSLTEKGYVVEAAIAWTDISPKANQMIGLELQINDADQSGSRIGTLSWYDQSGQGWSSPSVFGTVKLEGKEIVSPAEFVTDLGTWVSGSYSQNKALTEENEKRIRLTDALTVTAGNTYEASVSNPAFRIIVRQVLNGKVSTFYLSDKDRFEAVEGATYYVCVHNVYNNYKDLTFDQYVALFNDSAIGFALKDVTETVAKEITSLDANLTTGQRTSWVSGSYSINKAALEDNRVRIRMTDALAVTAGETYKAVITMDGKEVQSFRYIIREEDAAGKVTTFYLSSGQTFVAKEGATYYVTTQDYHNNYKNLDFQKYVELMTAKNGLVFDFVKVQ